MTTANIKSIDCENPETWQNKVFLTFDLDWASDEIINHTIDLIEKFDVYATWFITHYTPLINRLKENKKFELGIHPNFNFLLGGERRNGIDYKEITEMLLQIIPDSKSIRSHSLTQSTILQQTFVDKNLSHDCNHFIPYTSGIDLKPWKIWNGLIKCPHLWEDDLMCAYGNIDQNIVLNQQNLNVFDFHPIHIFLNTENLDRYELARPYFKDSKKLAEYVNTTKYGTKDFLFNLINKYILE